MKPGSKYNEGKYGVDMSELIRPWGTPTKRARRVKRHEFHLMSKTINIHKVGHHHNSHKFLSEMSMLSYVTTKLAL